MPAPSGHFQLRSGTRPLRGLARSTATGRVCAEVLGTKLRRGLSCRKVACDASCNQARNLAELESVVLCPVTRDLRNAVFRVTVEPNPVNGLHTLSQVMVDKLSTLPRARLSEPFGRLDEERMKMVDRALLLVVGVI